MQITRLADPVSCFSPSTTIVELRSLCVERSLSTSSVLKQRLAYVLQMTYTCNLLTYLWGLSLCRSEVQFALKGWEDLPVCLWLFHPMLLLPQPVYRHTLSLDPLDCQ